MRRRGKREVSFQVLSIENGFCQERTALSQGKIKAASRLAKTQAGGGGSMCQEMDFRCRISTLAMFSSVVCVVTAPILAATPGIP